MSKLRVLFAPRDIAGQPSEWAAALRRDGVDARVWSFGEPAFGLRPDRVWDQDRLLADPLYRWQVLDEAIKGFDVFHFQYGRSLIDAREPGLPELWDLPLLRSLGKRVYMHWHGSDVRLPSVHAEREPDSYLAGATVDEDAILAKVSVARRYCDAMFVSTAGLLDYVPDAELVPLALDVTAWRTPRGAEPAVPVVVHMPSRRSTKGSDLVDAALRPLHDEGVVVYRPLSGLTREQVKAEFAHADIVIDSLTIGDHGVVSCEAMASGAVAVAHVHERVRAREAMPGAAVEECPIVEATGATLGEAVRKLAADPAERARLRDVGQAWVAQRHDSKVVAKQLLAAYRRPQGQVVSAYPEWPESTGKARVKALEAEIERLRAQLGPAAGGVQPVPPQGRREKLEARPGLHLAVRRADRLYRKLRKRLR
jgi:glycosyltransferase involved in cell wall biosynthesis